MINAVQAVQIVQADESLKRIPDELKQDTFFSMNDWWYYLKSYHQNMCHLCDLYGDIKYFSGNDIRLTFPYMEVIDANTIFVNVHPNCKCMLHRVLGDTSKME